jgi:hypothetical protein
MAVISPISYLKTVSPELELSKIWTAAQQIASNMWTSGANEIAAVESPALSAAPGPISTAPMRAGHRLQNRRSDWR